MAKPFYSKTPYAVTISGEGGTGGGGGMRFISGEGEPGADIGAPGDAYLDTSNGDLYTNKNGTWTLELNLKGPKGDTGSAGKDGTDGAQGPKGEPGEDGEQGPAGTNGTDGKDAEPQFTQDQVDALLALIDEPES